MLNAMMEVASDERAERVFWILRTQLPALQLPRTMLSGTIHGF
jgi:hypothetical protein